MTRDYRYPPDEIDELNAIIDALRTEGRRTFERLLADNERLTVALQEKYVTDTKNDNHEIAYVRGLETEVERLRAESDISDGLLADARAEIEQLRTLIYRNCNAMTTNDKDAKTIQEIAAALERKP